jgi:hypothetical protein
VVDETAERGEDVLFALARGRSVDGHCVRAQVRILAELARLDELLQGAVCAGDDADVDADSLVLVPDEELLPPCDAKRASLLSGHLEARVLPPVAPRHLGQEILANPPRSRPHPR